MTDEATATKPISLRLTHDTGKSLKAGKRRYSDADGHNLYLDGDEVKDLGAPGSIRITVESGD